MDFLKGKIFSFNTIDNKEYFFIVAIQTMPENSNDVTERHRKINSYIKYGLS